MNVNKKFDRFKQWAGERMGGEVKTNASDDFKALETEMGVRHEGMERIHKSMNAYIKAISKRSEGEDKEKTLPIAHLGASMITHGQDFDMNSEFGQCLTSFGRTQERLARIQESYITQATSSWLESLERSLAQMKEYQTARKKLENRRLAYDASLAKMQKVKKEDFRVEEELRTQKAKYEESNEDVYRRMLDIRDAEADSVADLTAFLEAELDYHERCREVLLQLRNDWPGAQPQAQTPSGRRPGRPRANTAHSHLERYSTVEEEPPTPATESRHVIRSHRPVSSLVEPPRDFYSADPGSQRPAYSRNSTFEGPTQLRGDQSPAASERMSRLPSDNLTIRTTRSQLRPVGKAYDTYVDSPDDTGSYGNISPDRSYGERSASPATSHGSNMSRTASSTTLNSVSIGKKAPPPPPPRAKKPPPPPAKRYLVGAGDA